MKARAFAAIAAVVLSSVGALAPAHAASAADFVAGATISNVTINGLNLSNKSLRGITLNKVVLKNANFSRADLTGATITNSTLDGADFSYATLDGATITNTKIPAGRFKYITANSLTLEKCACNYAMFTSFALTKGSLANSSLKLATMTAANFNGTNLAGVALLEAQISHSTFTSLSMASANLAGSDFTKSSFSKVNLTGAQFGASTFATTRWNIVKVAGANLSLASLRGVESTSIIGKPILPKNAKLLSGMFQMAPAKPLFISTKRSGAKTLMYLYEALQTGAPGTLKVRVSTDKKIWSAWKTALGKRTYDDFKYQSKIQVQLNGLSAGQRYYVQAYLFNNVGKSKALSASFVA